MAAQLIATNGLRLRVESRCNASATSSFPEPVGPSIKTGVERGATSRMRRLTSSMHRRIAHQFRQPLDLELAARRGDRPNACSCADPFAN